MATMAAGPSPIARRRSLSLQQALAWCYCALFVVVTIITNLPMFNDAEGRNFGLFKIDPIDNVVHGLSGLWAGVAAWRSTGASRLYFRAFGLFYTLDAFIGLFSGYTILDFLLHWSAVPGYSVTNDPLTSFLANAPHFVIGPAALIAGFLLPDRLGTGHDAPRAG